VANLILGFFAGVVVGSLLGWAIGALWSALSSSEE
jgi:hypothetical protein